MAFAIQVLTITCPSPTGPWSFMLPHFTGAIMNGTVPGNPSLIRGNQQAKFAIQYAKLREAKEWSNPRPDQEEPEKCKKKHWWSRFETQGIWRNFDFFFYWMHSFHTRNIVISYWNIIWLYYIIIDYIYHQSFCYRIFRTIL